jgi:hypothetical protein
MLATIAYADDPGRWRVGGLARRRWQSLSLLVDALYSSDPSGACLKVTRFASGLLSRIDAQGMRTGKRLLDSAPRQTRDALLTT